MFVISLLIGPLLSPCLYPRGVSKSNIRSVYVVLLSVITTRSLHLSSIGLYGLPKRSLHYIWFWWWFYPVSLVLCQVILEYFHLPPPILLQRFSASCSSVWMFHRFFDEWILKFSSDAVGCLWLLFQLYESWVWSICVSISVLAASIRACTVSPCFDSRIAVSLR